MTFRMQGRSIVAFAVYAWCVLVIPTVAWWTSRTWLLVMALSGFAIALVTCSQILGAVATLTAGRSESEAARDDRSKREDR